MGNWRYEGVGPGGIRKVGMIKASSEREARKNFKVQKNSNKKTFPSLFGWNLILESF